MLKKNYRNRIWVIMWFSFKVTPLKICIHSTNAHGLINFTITYLRWLMFKKIGRDHWVTVFESRRKLTIPPKFKKPLTKCLNLWISFMRKIWQNSWYHKQFVTENHDIAATLFIQDSSSISSSFLRFTHWIWEDSICDLRRFNVHWIRMSMHSI